MELWIQDFLFRGYLTKSSRVAPIFPGSIYNIQRKRASVAYLARFSFGQYLASFCANGFQSALAYFVAQ